MSLVRREEFLDWYRHQAIDANAVRRSGAPSSALLAGADVSGNGEIALEQANDELSLLFDRLRQLDPNATSQAFEAGTREQPTTAGAAYNLITIHMRQKSGAADQPLGTRLLSEIAELAPIFAGRRGAKLRRVDGRATVGTPLIQDALNELAVHDERGKPSGYRSPFRVDYGAYRGWFGTSTERAVKAFQRSVPIGDDGVIGRVTITHLENALIAARGSTPATPPTTTPPSTGTLSSSRFRDLPIFPRILRGETTLARNARDKAAVEMMQASLYSLGYELGPAWIDKDFGGATEAALRLFQIDAGVPENGVLDRDTLLALDQRSYAQIQTLINATKSPGSKVVAYRLVADITPNRTQKIYVIDKSTQQPVASYLTSPGRAGYETAGNRFTVTRTLPRATWYPPNSAWARDLQPIGPGLNNPMGILKLDLGAYTQYIHGIPKSEERHLGQPASHGCLRMSPTNILHLFENYAELRTEVTINRNASESARLEAASLAANISDTTTSAGREYLAGYVSGELGTTQRV